MDSKLVGLALPLLLLFAVLDSGDAIMMPRAKKKVTDQQTSASFWSSNVTGTAAETHPELGVKRPSRKKNTLGASSSFMHLDFNTSATAELQTNLFLSLPDQCYRPCKAGDPPKMCYYQFTLEYYTVLGGACTRNGSNTQWLPTQCVRADGVEKGILTVNRMIPGPSIQVCKGDKVIIDVENHMEGMEVTIHWHGITQKGSQYYDGVPFITQCPIQQGNTFRYQWIASNAGTHFWHSHTGIQKIDGIHGSLIIREPPANDPNSHLYDEDLKTHVIFLSDWMHEVAAERYPGRRTNNTGQAPDNILINGKGQFSNPKTGFTTNTPLEVFTMTPGKRYRFRMINSFCTVCPAELKIQGHDLNLIAADGEPVLPVKVKTIISFSGERYDFVINADRAIGAYWIQVRGLGECREKKIQQLAILKYENGTDQPTTPKPSYNDSVIPEGVVLNPLDARCNGVNAICVTQLKNARDIDKGILAESADVKILLPFRFHAYHPDDLFAPNTYNRYLVTPGGEYVLSLIDGISYLSPPTPLLTQYDDIAPTQFCNGDRKPVNCADTCMCTHKIDIPINSTVEVILIDEVQRAHLSHPFHLHGHSFYVMDMGQSPDKNVTKINLNHVIDLDNNGRLHRQFNSPPAKDTIAVPNNGYVVLRFRANNPGFWLFHCHFLFHIVIGMNLVFQVGTHADLPPVPTGFPTCGDFKPEFDQNVANKFM